MAVVRVGDRPISFDRGPSHLVKILLLIMIMIMIMILMIMRRRRMIMMILMMRRRMMRMMRMMIRYQVCGHYSDDNDVLMSIIMIESPHLLTSPHLVVRQHLNPRTKTEHTLETKKVAKTLKWWWPVQSWRKKINTCENRSSRHSVAKPGTNYNYYIGV